ncbi:hypothetical protein FS842_002155 [Serendipita sp. 407]|nr:hypothetical protein FS842_002155 [Serendipita sp. 407]
MAIRAAEMIFLLLLSSASKLAIGVPNWPLRLRCRSMGLSIMGVDLIVYLDLSPQPPLSIPFFPSWLVCRSLKHPPVMGTTSIVFPSQNEVLFRTLTSLAIFFSLSIMSFCFAHRSLEIGLFTKRGLRSLTFPRILLMTLLIWSWSFILCCGILIQGVGISLNARVCDAVVLTCLFLYFTSKGILYMILIERVYIVWPHRGTRRSSTVFKFCVVVLIGFFVILFVGLNTRRTFIRDDLQCEIGLDRVTTIVAAVYDSCACLALAGLFLWPLYKHANLSPALRRVAIRTITATSCCLSMTLVNLALLARGHELGWTCLLICCLDICGNTLVMFWLTRPASKYQSSVDNSVPSHTPANGNNQTFPSAGSCSKSSPLRMTHLEERIAIDNALFHAPRRIDRTWKPKWTWSLSSDAHGERRPSTPGGVLGKFWSPRRPSDTGEGPTTSFARPRENEGEKTPSSTNYKSEATLCSLNVMVSVRTNNDALEDVEQLYECEDQMQETTNDFYHAI